MPKAGTAIASLVLGILSVACFGIFAGIPAVICGHVALSELGKNPRLTGKGMAIAGLITGYVGIFVTIALIILVIWSVTRAAPFIYTLF